MRIGPLKRIAGTALLLLPITFAQGQERTAPSGYTEWRAYHGGPESLHYSSLKQIDRTNVLRAGI